MNVVCIRRRQCTEFGELLGRAKAHHSLRPVRSSEDDRIPVPVGFRRHVAQVRDGAVETKGPASLKLG